MEIDNRAQVTGKTSTEETSVPGSSASRAPLLPRGPSRRGPWEQGCHAEAAAN